MPSPCTIAQLKRRCWPPQSSQPQPIAAFDSLVAVAAGADVDADVDADAVAVAAAAVFVVVGEPLRAAFAATVVELSPYFVGHAVEAHVADIVHLVVDITDVAGAVAVVVAAAIVLLGLTGPADFET